MVDGRDSTCRTSAAVALCYVGRVMKGDPEIIDCLKKLLTGELTAMDVYFVQSRMLDDWGYGKLRDRLAHEFDDEKAHADALIQRILFLGGVPDMAARLPFKVGDTPREMFEVDVALEYDVAKHLNDAIKLARDKKDNTTRELLEPLLKDTEEDHIWWLETQLRLMKELGEDNYLAQQL